MFLGSRAPFAPDPEGCGWAAAGPGFRFQGWAGLGPWGLTTFSRTPTRQFDSSALKSAPIVTRPQTSWLSVSRHPPRRSRQNPGVSLDLSFPHTPGASAWRTPRIQPGLMPPLPRLAQPPSSSPGAMRQLPHGSLCLGPHPPETSALKQGILPLCLPEPSWGTPSASLPLPAPCSLLWAPATGKLPPILCPCSSLCLAHCSSRYPPACMPPTPIGLCSRSPFSEDSPDHPQKLRAWPVCTWVVRGAEVKAGLTAQKSVGLPVNDKGAGEETSPAQRQPEGRWVGRAGSLKEGAAGGTGA